MHWLALADLLLLQSAAQYRSETMGMSPEVPA